MTNRIKRPHLHRRENSWYLRTGVMHNFLCKCGQVDQFWNVVSNIHHPDHRCGSCGNNHYLDSLMFLTDEKVTRWSTFNWSIETVKTDESWIVRAYASIPLFDHVFQKIRFRKTIIATNTLFFTGKNEYHEDYPMIMKKFVYNHLDKATLMKELMDEELEEALYNFILSVPMADISWIEDEKLDKLSMAERIKLFSFFLKHEHLKEYDFFYWDNFEIFHDISKQYPSVKEMLSFVANNRKEKSIKKAYFESYVESMKIHSRYKHMTDYLFARHIEDRNFLLELIQIDFRVKHVLFDEVPMITVEYFLEFLREHYTQKAITKLFTALDRRMFRYDNIVRDTIQMFRGEHANFIREHFRKVPLNFQRLHDEFIRVNALHNGSLRGKIAFEYHDNDVSAQTKRDTFVYHLPKTIHVLQHWSQQLHNCMYGYSHSIHQGRSIIYGVYKEDVLTYAVEIRRNKIVQALGKYNRRIDAEERAEIDEWFKEVYIKSWMGA